MLLLKVLSLTFCLYMTHGSQSSEELETLLASPVGVNQVRTVIQEAYNADQMYLISIVVGEQQENDMNITLIGTQNIYGSGGEIIEVRTLELHIPRIANSSVANKDNEDDDDDDNDIYDIVEELKKVFEFHLWMSLNFPMDITAAEYTKTGDVLHSIYLDLDSLHGYTEGIYFTNETIEVNTSQAVNDHIKELQANQLPVSVHKFDGNGQFLSEESNIIPEYIVSVVSEEGDADQSLLDEAQKGLATVGLKYQNNRDEVPRKLSEYLSLKYPQYDFNVFLNEPKSWYVNKDYKINLRYELTDWESSEDLIYSIFVLTKEEKVTSLNATVAQ